MAPQLFPLVALRDAVIFPYLVCPLLIGRPRSLKAVDEASHSDDKRVLLVTQRDLEQEDPRAQHLYRVGTLAQIHQYARLPDGPVKILVEGLERVHITRIRRRDPWFQAYTQPFLAPAEEEPEHLEALKRVVLEDFARFVEVHPRIPEHMVRSLKEVEEPARVADLLAAFLQVKLPVKQQLLELPSVAERLLNVGQHLHRQVQLLHLEQDIQKKVHSQLERSQKEFFLREQLKVIQEELGDDLDELGELKARLAGCSLPSAHMPRVLREVRRLEKLPAMAPEAGILRNYLECLVSLPWQGTPAAGVDLETTERILEAEHYGLKKVTERILEFLAVDQLLTLRPEAPHRHQPTILCLVGPPGVGKSSLAQAIARGLGRTFGRVSLGGVHDEAEIRGHRRTYIGAMPGKILQALRDVGARNPVLLLDEIDKLGRSLQGDPAAALLEVLDPEQNQEFVDHFVEVPFNLQEVFFICTANSTDTIPTPLLDRLEVIQLSGYTEGEKLAIARQHLLPKQLNRHGLSTRQIQIQQPALAHLVRQYTREAGVRGLERSLGALCRKVARQVLKDSHHGTTITLSNLQKYLGIPPYPPEERPHTTQVGVCSGLAWTPYGGCTLQIEVNVMPGQGKLQLTGQLGEVMKESAQAAFSYIRAHCDELGIPTHFPKEVDVHIHIPEGATPKDGPSAGIAMATAMVSALTGRPVRHEIAMTGEITLRGSVLAIGGLKEKSLAAYRSGLKKVFLPKSNQRDLADLPREVAQSVVFIPVEHLSEVLALALERPG
ncbi:endopeptidase La [Anthocerotibacter panamensis]|uniref:endopeptidase La n=1 Tax=Anthocerotibacter panamensis TaxID=2857077 RepID=UPI001C4016CB|nr:endopeptidase La [Anthocerotibacter panamensis]